MLDQAKSKGAKGDGFDKLEQRLHETAQEPLEASKIAIEAQPPKPFILDSLKLDQAIKLAKKKAKEGSPEEAKRIYQDILTKFPKNKRARDGLKGLACQMWLIKLQYFKILHTVSYNAIVLRSLPDSHRATSWGGSCSLGNWLRTCCINNSHQPSVMLSTYMGNASKSMGQLEAGYRGLQQSPSHQA